MRPDFCKVRLTEAGEAFAQGMPLRFSNGRTQFTFTPGAAQEVARYEWDLILKNHTTVDGKSLFEVVVDPAPAESNTQQAEEKK
jgi:hypothetical protein